MAINQRRWRVKAALITSLAINGVLVLIGLSINPRQYPASRFASFLAALTAPSTALAEWIAPHGHDAPHFAGAAVIAIVSSVLFYAIFVWFLLSLPIWWRQRQ
jgi:hypothetical protein